MAARTAHVNLREKPLTSSDSVGDVSGDMLREIDATAPPTPPPTFGRKASQQYLQRPTSATGTVRTERSEDEGTLTQHEHGDEESPMQSSPLRPKTPVRNGDGRNAIAPAGTLTPVHAASLELHGSPQKSPQKKSFDSRRVSTAHSRSFMEDVDLENLSGTEFDVASRSGTSMAVPKVGGFGVREDTVPHGEGMKSAASERADRPAPSGHEPMQWGQYFWTIITDPQSSMSFFANPHTGECRWEVPAGTFVLPPNPEGQWWELFDSLRGVPYFYHTTTQKTQWERPNGLVIPMTAIQESSAGRRFSKQNFGTDTLASLAIPIEQQVSPTASPKQSRPSGTAARFETPRKGRSNQPPPPAMSPSIEQVIGMDGGDARELRKAQLVAEAMIAQSPRAPRSRVTTMAREANGSAGFQDSSPDEGFGLPQTIRNGSSPLAHKSDNEPKEELSSPTRSRRLSAGQTGNLQRNLAKSLTTISSRGTMTQENSSSKPSTSINTHEMRISAPLRSPKQPISPRMTTPSDAPRPVRVSLDEGAGGKMPQELKDEIRKFDFSQFAESNFSQHRTGFFRKKMPMGRMMRWQKDTISAPLLTLPRQYNKHAVTSFKVVQRVCGERQTPVHSKVPVPLQAPNQSISAQEYKAYLEIQGLTRPPTVLEEIRWLLDIGIAHSPLRDEIFVQIIKQLTENPNPTSVFRGWQLMCVILSSAFPPSRDLQSYLRSWISQKEDDESVGVMAEYCSGRLEAIQKRGPRGKPPSLMEIQCALENPFNPGVFGITLEKVMQTQESAYPQAQVPIILMFLTDAMLALDALKTKGIFRVAGNLDQVIELRVRIERGHYSLSGLLGADNSDVTVPASVFKLWLRELEEPLIPQSMYNECVDAAAKHSPEACIDLVRKLPTLHRRVVLFVISFLQMFCDSTVLRSTRLTLDSLALIFAPNFFRLASEQLDVAWRNAHWEQQFLKYLLESLDCQTLDADYAPTHGEGPEMGIPSSNAASSQHHPSTLSHPTTSSQHGYANVLRTAAWSDNVRRLTTPQQDGTDDSSPEVRYISLPQLPGKNGLPPASIGGIAGNGVSAHLHGKSSLAYASESSADW